MTDYITSLQQTLREAAAREYPARPPSPEPKRRVLRKATPTELDAQSTQRFMPKPRRAAPRFTRVVRGPLALTAAAVMLTAAVATTVVLLLGATATTPAAYALTKNSDGSVTVSVRNLQTAIRPLNRRFAALGIPERIIPITKACTHLGGAVYAIKQSQLTNLPWTFTVRKSRKWLAPGDTGFMAIGRSDRGQLLYSQGAMKPPLPTCFKNIATGSTDSTKR